MDSFELRIEITEGIARELLWRALTPDESLIMFNELNQAIDRQAEQQGVSTDGRQVSGISVTVENGVMYAEIGYLGKG